MSKSIYLLPILLFLISCSKSNKYVYIEVIDDYDLYNNKIITYSEPEIFEASDDSVAYCLAVDKFYKTIYASKMTENTLKKSGKSMPIKKPKLFHLFTKDSIDISEGEHLDNPIDIVKQSDNKYKRISEKYIK